MTSYSTKRNTFILKCFLQFTSTNSDGSQKDGVKFLNLLQKKVPRKGGFPQKRGDSNPRGNYYYYKFWILQNILWNVLFSFTNISQGNFLYYQKNFITTKVLRTARTTTELKQNLLHWPFFFRYFSQVIEHQARRVQSFSELFKISLFNCDREGARLYQCFSPRGS